jgi:hypothetical protein
MSEAAKSGVRSTAESYAYQAIRNGKRAKQVAKDTTLIAPLRSAIIENEITKPDAVRHSSVHNAIQFAKFMDVSTPKIVGNLYGGLIRGAAKGVRDNLKGK